ncbi:Uncharacterised protein [Pantoea agglomerans]|uniref:Uncharacterized protein n=1 Tax=Enterobacter agglomerans TaxID=549 RepID=A0A379AN95_ENTAG|nr:Uncharacterised protein [Pantoea agglomerans]
MSDQKTTRREQRAQAQEFIDSLQSGSAFPPVPPHLDYRQPRGYPRSHA